MRRAIRVLVVLLGISSSASGQTTLPAPPRLGGYLQARTTGQERAGIAFALNRVRLSADGSLPSRFSYRVLVEFQAAAGARNPAQVSLREAMIRWNPGPWSVTAGEFKTPFVREYLIPVPQLETADLAAVTDSLAPKYDVGVVAEYSFGATLTCAAGVFNGEGQNSTTNRDSVVLAVGRVTARPLAQLGIGASVARDGRDSLRWGVDAAFEERGVLLRAEYATRHRRGRDRSRDDFGWYVFAGCRVAAPVQLFARQEDFQRPAFGTARRVRGTSVGSNFEVVPGRVRLLLQATRRHAGANQARSDSFIAQAQVRF